MDLRDLLEHQIHRQATLQPRMALPAGRTVSLEEGQRLAKLYLEEEQRVAAKEKSHAKKGDGVVVLEENVSKKIVLLRRQQNKEANVAAAVAYAHRQKQQHQRVLQAVETEKVLEVAQKMHRKDAGTHEAHHRRQRAKQSTKKRGGKETRK